MADAVQFLGVSAKNAKAAESEPAEESADRPAIGAYRRKAS